MRRRGLSLAEALISTFLLMTVLAVVALLANQYSRVVRSSHHKSVGRQVALSLLTIRSDLEAGVEVVTPTLGGGPSDLRFFRVDTGDPDRFPATIEPTPDPGPDPWLPTDPSYLTDVVYTLQNGDLIRELDPPGGDASVVASEVNDFSARSVGPDQIELVMSHLDGTRVRTYRLPVNIRASVVRQP
ncbi:MAG: hypothetical protein AB1758_30165 [Candidatus Eremiobacterota bacterium]